MKIESVMSSGTPGVELGALDAARAENMPIGGWGLCTSIPSGYGLRELLAGEEGLSPIEANIVDSDYTLFFYEDSPFDELEIDAANIMSFCDKYRKPWGHVDVMHKHPVMDGIQEVGTNFSGDGRLDNGNYVAVIPPDCVLNVVDVTKGTDPGKAYDVAFEVVTMLIRMINSEFFQEKAQLVRVLLSLLPHDDRAWNTIRSHWGHGLELRAP